jgi:UDP-glucose 4-epimerase
VTTAADRQEVRRSVVDGTRHAAEAARAAGARFVLASTVAVYGDAPGHQVIDESRPPSPTTPYGEAKLESEQVTRSIDPRAIILRLALVYGPRDRGNFLKLVRAVDRRRAFIVGEGNNRKSVIFVHNLAQRLVRCVDPTVNDIAGVWNAADSPAPTQRELVQHIAAALGRRTPVAVPEALATRATAWLDRGASLLHRRTSFNDQVRKLAASTEFSGAALDKRLGARPLVDLADGIRQTVRWYRTSGTR